MDDRSTCSHWQQTDLFVRTSHPANMVSMNWISRTKQMPHCNHLPQSTGSQGMDQCESGGADLKINLTGIDPPSSLLPKRLDKPVYTSSSQSYADVLKKQFSLNPNSQTQTAENNWPPRKWQATVIDYDSDQLVNSPLSTSTTTLSTNSSSNLTQAMIHTAMAPNAYAMELLALKQEICQL